MSQTFTPLLILVITVICGFFLIPIIMSVISGALSNIGGVTKQLSGLAKQSVKNVLSMGGNFTSMTNNICQQGIAMSTNILSNTIPIGFSILNNCVSLGGSTINNGFNIIENASVNIIGASAQISANALAAASNAIVSVGSIIIPQILGFQLNYFRLGAKIISVLAKPIGAIINVYIKLYTLIRDNVAKPIGLISDNFGEILKIFNKILDFIKGGFENISGDIVDGLGNIVTGIGGGLGDIGGNIVDGLGGVVTGIGDGLGGIGGNIVDGLGGVVTGIGDGLGDIGGNVTSGLGNIVTGIGDGLTGIGGNVTSGLGGVTGSITGGLTGIDGIGHNITTALASVTSSITGGLIGEESIKSVLNIGLLPLSLIKTEIETVSSGITTTAGYINEMKTIFEEISSGLGSIGGFIGTIAGAFTGLGVEKFVMSIVTGSLEIIQKALVPVVTSILKGNVCGWLPKIFGQRICHMESCKILINRDGNKKWILLKNLKIGDSVVTHDGSLEKVLYIIEDENYEDIKVYDFSSESHPIFDGTNNLKCYKKNDNFAYLDMEEISEDNAVIRYVKSKMITIETEGPNNTYSCKKYDKTITFRDVSYMKNKNFCAAILMYEFITQKQELFDFKSENIEEIKVYFKNIVYTLHKFMNNYVEEEPEEDTANILNFVATYSGVKDKMEEEFNIRFNHTNSYKLFYVIYNIFYLYEKYISYEKIKHINFKNLVIEVYSDSALNVESDRIEYID